jgi:hypothetical protein
MCISVWPKRMIWAEAVLRAKPSSRHDPTTASRAGSGTVWSAEALNRRAKNPKLYYYRLLLYLSSRQSRIISIRISADFRAGEPSLQPAAPRDPYC